MNETHWEMDKSEENRMEKNKNSGSALARKMAVSLVCGLAAGFAFMMLREKLVVPVAIMEDGKPVATIKDKDTVICYNFRPDRAREITRAFCAETFDGCERGTRKDITYICFTEYDVTIPNKEIAFKKEELANTFGEFLAANGKTQARIAETEKYAHVTFFFNGGVDRFRLSAR